MKKAGFTLIELLLVTAILAILATAVIMTLDAPRRLRESRDTRRQSDVETILNAVHLYFLDQGTFPTGLSAGMNEVQLGTAASGCQVQSGGCNALESKCLDLRAPLARYLQEIPRDPNLRANTRTYAYTISIDANRIVTIKACGAESAGQILISR